MQGQRRHARELLDLGGRLLVLLVAVVLRRGGGEPGDVGQRLAAFVRQRRVLAGSQTERAEEATAPFEQSAAALGQTGIVVGQQQREIETLVIEQSGAGIGHAVERAARSEEHTSELQSLMRTSYAVLCLKKKTFITS